MSDHITCSECRHLLMVAGLVNDLAGRCALVEVGAGVRGDQWCERAEVEVKPEVVIPLADIDAMVGGTA